MITAHGGTLVNKVADTSRKEELTEKAGQVYNLQIADRFASDCEMIAIGGFSPLTGFMDKQTAMSVINNMQLQDGTVWGIPILLQVNDSDNEKINTGDTIALIDSRKVLIAIMKVEEKFQLDIDNYCQKVYKTTDAAHPGVNAVKEAGNNYISGDIELVNRPVRENIEDKYFIDPADTRAAFEAKGWKTIVAFQTRNPIHRAHEYLLKCALESVDGLLIHPLVGETKPDDIPADVRMKCYEILMKDYFNLDKTMLSVLPMAMRYAGPREAVHHMIIRKNYGCTHIIIGRDHAGVGDYYGTYEAQEMVDSVKGKMEIVPMKFEHSFYCNKCENMCSAKTCPHPNEDHVFLSGTKVRAMLGEGQRPPKEFSRPEVADELIKWATSKNPVTSG